MAKGAEIRICNACSHNWSRVLRKGFEDKFGPKLPMQRIARSKPHMVSIGVQTEPIPAPRNLVKPIPAPRASIGQSAKTLRNPKCPMCGSKATCFVGDAIQCYHNHCGVLSTPLPPHLEPKVVVRNVNTPGPASRWSDKVKDVVASGAMFLQKEKPKAKIKNPKRVAEGKPPQVQEHRQLSGPKTKSKLVNQQLAGPFSAPLPKQNRDTMAPVANKRVVRAVVEDNKGQHAVVSMRKATTTATERPTPEDFRWIRQLCLPRMLKVETPGNVGVWIVVPDILKSPKMEYFDVWWLALLAVGRTSEANLLAEKIGKIRFSRALKAVEIRKRKKAQVESPKAQSKNRKTVPPKLRTKI